ncbi:IclR family transcriptional regulator [Mycobacterium sp. MS1601]|uniref:IclR family transcriptional regulator n=1 Tax=Mycobacterium sp. MS1601 TaxID=1936029 RepID=UPI00178CE81F|nr:IclR family transcriptional regulator [Mycobacterium sp. MS1601]
MIQSVERAFNLIERVAASRDGARLSELADGAGLNRSTAHNLLASLEELGYITQDDKGAPYRLSGKLGRLLRPSVEAEHALRRRVRPVLEAVGAATGETAYLAFVAGEEYLCADAVQSDQPLHLTVVPGEREPLIGTAIGHALLAADPDLTRVVRELYPDMWLRHAEPIADAARDGFALDLDTFHPGVSCVALAVAPNAAIGVAGPTSRLPKTRLVTIAGQIRNELTAH